MLFVKFRDGSAYLYEGVDHETYKGFPDGHGARAYWDGLDLGPSLNLGKNPALLTEDQPWQEEDIAVAKPELVRLASDGNSLVVSSDGSGSFSGNVSGGSSLTVNVKASGNERYGVKYTVEHDGTVTGPFEPEFVAADETDAIVQLNNGLDQLVT